MNMQVIILLLLYILIAFLPAKLMVLFSVLSNEYCSMLLFY